MKKRAHSNRSNRYYYDLEGVTGDQIYSIMMDHQHAMKSTEIRRNLSEEFGKEISDLAVKKQLSRLHRGGWVKKRYTMYKSSYPRYQIDREKMKKRIQILEERIQTRKEGIKNLSVLLEKTRAALDAPFLYNPPFPTSISKHYAGNFPLMETLATKYAIEQLRRYYPHEILNLTTVGTTDGSNVVVYWRIEAPKELRSEFLVDLESEISFFWTCKSILEDFFNDKEAKVNEENIALCQEFLGTLSKTI